MENNNNSRRLGLYFSVFTASLGGFSCGTILGWSSAVTYLPSTIIMYDDQVLIQKKDLPLIASAAPLGALLFAFPSKKLADSLGRTPVMLFAMVLFLLSWIMLAFIDYNNLEVLIAGRLIGGMAMGATWLVSQIYIKELSREFKFLIIFKIFTSLGLLFVNSLQLFTDWQEYHLLPALVPLIFALCFLNLPESPVYYVKNGKNGKAQRSLKFLGQELNNPQESVIHLRAVIVCLGLSVYQRLTNIAGINFYLGSIIAKASPNFNLFISIIIIYFLDILTQIFSLLFLEKTKRKLLLILSATIIALMQFSLGIFFQLKYCDINFNYMEYIPIILISIFFMAYSIGFGPIPELISNELFDASGFVSVINWLIIFLVTYIYPTMMEKFDDYHRFYVFGLIMISGVVFVAIFVPDSQGKSYKVNT